MIAIAVLVGLLFVLSHLVVYFYHGGKFTNEVLLHYREEDWVWDVVASANRRRKRLEHVLKRERLRHEKDVGHLRYQLAGALHQSMMFKVEVAALQDRQKKLEDQNQNLAGDLAEHLLKEEDRAKVRENLVKKIR